MNKKKINKKYIVGSIQFLTLVLGLSLSAIVFQRTFKIMDRFIIIVITAILYVFWGIWHHSTNDRADKLVILEYSLVSVIVILLSALALGIVRFF